MAQPDPLPPVTDDAAAADLPPRWLLVLGVVLILALLVIAAFALGAYVAERGLLGPLL